VIAVIIILIGRDFARRGRFGRPDERRAARATYTTGDSVPATSSGSRAPRDPAFVGASVDSLTRNVQHGNAAQMWTWILCWIAFGWETNRWWRRRHGERST